MDGDLLQAVVLADSFDTKFYPITLEMPRSLLPLVNVPTIDYTLEFLVGAGVQEIFILCCWKAQQIQAYISQSRWTETPNVVIRTIASTRCLSTGDALREIYNLQIISSDFVLVSGDVISNMKLQPVLQAHRARRKQDKSTIMTVVYKKAAPNHRSRSQEDDSVVVINPATGQLLNLENDREEDAVNLDTDVFAENSSVQFRYDLLDCRIDICSPEVLSVCADNFDYNDLRQDFIRGVVVDEVYKWAYPMVPDCNFMGTTSYKYLRGNIYQEEGIKLARSATLGRDTVIGQGTEVGNNTFISHSVIGRNCKIGANVKIVGSYIWNGATVADGATISYSIVCNEARIMAGAVVDKASLVSFRAVVGTDRARAGGGERRGGV
ncbi:eIF4gamma/eIF5/eIF2-epsilon domain containing protein [Acanthamoeba castellanii str. Neff]|uniref:eIF4gamma/eIF5/eIF2-epsilon domain containing protein n=1 Tax=Acanthamoeba castellanii (strain ATCC 30010 / Neff) TaxID=1257118 RepID=L8GG90_ACACF|nr:eIF4gamma/eIF5/eIF2-epsilon domain containing protein [Acanthamoeba castellanii str. Neff]ELR12007.1 eIF4gamma/eIF5/eIF2-epsilon domain containing protein [Acanthamoeba castellanii str. Neff]